MPAIPFSVFGKRHLDVASWLCVGIGCWCCELEYRCRMLVLVTCMTELGPVGAGAKGGIRYLWE